MKITVEQPSARELVDRSRVLVHVMLEHPDDIGPNYALLLILADQLQLLRDAFEEDEIRRLRDEKLPQYFLQRPQHQGQMLWCVLVQFGIQRYIRYLNPSSSPIYCLLSKKKVGDALCNLRLL